MKPRYSILAVALGLGLTISVAVPAGQQGEASGPDAIRSQLILALRPVAVSFPAGLAADQPDHRTLLSGSGSPSARVRVATLHSHPLLRLGTLDGSEFEGLTTEDDRPIPLRYDLWLTRNAGAWTLHAQQADSGDDPTSDDVVGTIPLEHAVAESSSTLSAALVPTTDDTGQLVLRWGDHSWTADFDFADPPENQDRQQDGADGVRDFDSDTTAIARAVTLAERHETAITLPGGSRISLLYWQNIGTGHVDFDAIASMTQGDVIRLTEAAVIRLRTEAHLQFGPVAVPTDNLAPDFPGSYGLWLKKAGRGWHLVFNNEPDSWGTQYKPALDAAAVEVAYTHVGSSTRPLGAALMPTTEHSGRLVIYWGPHEWSARFTVGS